MSTLVAVALLPEEGGVCLIVTDLTRQKAYEAMVAAQALERSILEQAIDAIVLCDLDGRVIRASRAALELCSQNPLLLPFAESFPLESDGRPPDLAAALYGPVRGAEYNLRRPGVARRDGAAERGARHRRGRDSARLRRYDDRHHRAARGR